MPETSTAIQKPAGRAHETIVMVADTDLVEQLRTARENAAHDFAMAQMQGAENTRRERERADKAEAELRAIRSRLDHAIAMEQVVEGMWKSSCARCTCGAFALSSHNK